MSTLAGTRTLGVSVLIFNENPALWSPHLSLHVRKDTCLYCFMLIHQKMVYNLHN